MEARGKRAYLIRGAWRTAPRQPNFLLRRAWRARYSLPRMFRFLFSPLAALAGLLIVFTSCERHHVGELPELQKEHLHPLEAAAEEPVRAALPNPPLASPTPANFFPNQQP